MSDWNLFRLMTFLLPLWSLSCFFCKAKVAKRRLTCELGGGNIGRAKLPRNFHFKVHQLSRFVMTWHWIGFVKLWIVNGTNFYAEKCNFQKKEQKILNWFGWETTRGGGVTSCSDFWVWSVGLVAIFFLFRWQCDGWPRHLRHNAAHFGPCRHLVLGIFNLAWWNSEKRDLFHPRHWPGEFNGQFVADGRCQGNAHFAGTTGCPMHSHQFGLGFAIPHHFFWPISGF